MVATKAETIPEIGLRKRLAFGAVAAVVVAVVIEALALAAGKFLQSKYKMFGTPVAQRSEWFRDYDDYLRLRDPRLGWPFAVELAGASYDSAGARRSPAFPDPATSPAKVAVFGDSFAYGSEVDDAQAWPNLLAVSLGARVGNFGVPGYGTDQGYLRYSTWQGERAEVVILTHLAEGVMRNLTRNWDLFTQKGYYALKPRFRLEGGKLVPVPLPRLTESEYRRVVGLESPFLPLEHENFQPGGPTGVTRLEFPYTVSMLRNLGSYQMRALLARRPDHAEFYRPDHPLGGLQLAAKILETFDHEARAKGQRPLVVLLPTIQDLTYAKRNGAMPYAPLAQELGRAGVAYVDFGPRLLKHIGEREIRPFFKPHRHYNEEVSQLLAETVREALSGRGASG